MENNEAPLDLPLNCLLVGLEGVLCLVDDVVVFEANHAEHDSRLDAVMRNLQNAGLRLESIMLQK